MTASKALNPFKVIFLTASLAFLYAGTLWKLGFDWWTDENYSHGLLIPLVIAYMLWMDRDRLSRRAGSPALLLGGSLILFSVLALWAGTAGAELYLQRMSLVSMLAGICIYFWGARIMRAISVPLVLLLLAIPIPAIIFNKIAFPLQLFASRCAVATMRLLDIPVLRQGNVIELMPLNASETRKLEVVEACSGIRSLMTLLTLAVVLAYLTGDSVKKKGGGERGKGRGEDSISKFRVVRSVVLVLSAIPIAIVTNAFRVSGTGVLAHFYGTEVADGFFHSFSGWVVYIVAFGMLFAVSWIIDRFATGSQKNGMQAPPEEEGASTPAIEVPGLKEAEP
jgi:exosortase